MSKDTKIIYYGVCLDSNDPLMAGRIRAVLDDDFKGESPKNYDESKLAKIFNGDVGKSSDNGGDPKYATADSIKWSDDDPHVRNPFLPLYFNLVPRMGEAVKLISYISNKTAVASEDVEYIGPLISQPTKLGGESYSNSRIFTTKGTRQPNSVLPTLRGNSDSQGVFPYEGTIALRGRLDSDLLFGNRQLILRAGQTQPQDKEVKIPKTNFTQSVIQLDNYSQELSLTKKEEKKEVKDDAPLKHIIEYEITSEYFSGSSTIKIYDGFISIYNLTPKDGKEPLLSGDFGVSTDVSNHSNKNFICVLRFAAHTEDETIRLLNDFLYQAQNDNVGSPPHNFVSTPTGIGTSYQKVFEDEINFNSMTPNLEKLMNLHPFYFRPTKFSLVIDTIFHKISLLGVEQFGRIFSKNNVFPDVKTETTEIDVESYEARTQGITTILSNEILLFSYDETIPEKGKPTPLVTSFKSDNHELGDNVGVNQKNLVKMSRDNMEPLVRGEQLLILLTQMWDWIQNHEHGTAGTQPKDPAKETSVTKGDVVKLISSAKNTVLNKHIRIN
tara:strand:+ start:1586 stop:3247 length:1662 start_codon:yes stop_codon:yes gene_type:complete